MGARSQAGLRAALLLAAACAAVPAQAVPSTFAPIIGSALLCRSHLDNAYFYDYLTTAFGPPYKREGGAWWFKTDAALWGASISDVLVSDDSSDITFIGAVTDGPPEQLDAAIRAAVGVVHSKADLSAFAPLVASPGSRIVWYNTQSKIYCAHFKQQAP